jgi:hypothetical protein
MDLMDLMDLKKEEGRRGMGIIEQQQAIVDAINEREAVDAPTALAGLQAVYRDKRLPLATRMRAMAIAIQYESPKLAVTAYLSDAEDFAARLDRALARSHNAPLIGHRGKGE